MASCSGGEASCSECDSMEVIIKKARKSYCRSCWRCRCEFQFRKRLFEFGRPSKGSVGEVFKPAEKVLICYDGSPSSVALINLALNALVFGNSSLNEGSTTKLPFPFKFAILVVLESELNGSPGVEGRQKQHLQSLLRWTKYADRTSDGVSCPLLATCLEMSLKEHINHGEICNPRLSNSTLVVKLVDSVQSDESKQAIESDCIEQKVCSSEIENLKLPFNEEFDVHLSELRKSLKTKTEDKDFTNILKRNLVYSVADHLKISKVLLPEDQTSLAVKMFAMMSNGRGSQIADEMTFTSSINEGIVIARPLIDFSDIDLRAYLQTLDEVCTNGIISKGSNKRKMKIDSVERQCDDFITNLQQGYPATVSTLTRIGSKLQSTSSTQMHGHKVQETTWNRCRLCKRQSDSDAPSPENVLCYGCKHFLNDAHPAQIGHFRNLLRLGNRNAESS